MNPRHSRFYLDKRNGKFLGVCAGIADYTGFDVTLVRIATVLGVVLGSGIVFLLYLITAWVAEAKPVILQDIDPEQQRFWQGVRSSPSVSVREVRSRYRDIDRRLGDIEHLYTASNNRLAQEIDNLK